MQFPNRKPGKAAKDQRARLFRDLRAHQRNVAAEDGGTVTRYMGSGRTETTYASAPYGEHAASAFYSAITQQHFHSRLRSYVKRMSHNL